MPRVNKNVKFPSKLFALMQQQNSPLEFIKYEHDQRIFIRVIDRDALKQVWDPASFRRMLHYYNFETAVAVIHDAQGNKRRITSWTHPAFRPAVAADARNLARMHRIRTRFYDQITVPLIAEVNAAQHPVEPQVTVYRAAR